MKKNLFLAAFAVVAMASCSKTEVSDPAASAAEKSSVGFTTFIDRATKGAEANQATLQSNSFGAICYQQNNADWASTTVADVVLMNNYKVKFGAGAWTYDDVDGQYLKYWEENAHLSFFAYSPYSDGTGSGISDFVDLTTDNSKTDAAPYFTFTTDTTIADQVDLLAASVMNKTNTGAAVDFKFDHILSKIGFTVEPSVTVDNTGVAVQDVKVAVIDNTGETGTSDKFLNADGKFTFSTDNTTSNAAWSIDGYTTPLEITEVSVLDSELFDFDATASSSDNTIQLNKGTSATDIMAADGYLMIVPQEMTANDIIQVTVEYYYLTKTDEANPTVSSLLTKVVYIPAIEFEMGKQYTYNIKVGRDAIVFDKNIGVNTWGDVVDNTIE